MKRRVSRQRTPPVAVAIAGGSIRQATGKSGCRRGSTHKCVNLTAKELPIGTKTHDCSCTHIDEASKQSQADSTGKTSEYLRHLAAGNLRMACAAQTSVTVALQRQLSSHRDYDRRRLRSLTSVQGAYDADSEAGVMFIAALVRSTISPKTASERRKQL